MQRTKQDKTGRAPGYMYMDPIKIGLLGPKLSDKNRTVGKNYPINIGQLSDKNRTVCVSERINRSGDPTGLLARTDLGRSNESRTAALIRQAIGLYCLRNDDQRKRGHAAREKRSPVSGQFRRLFK